MRFHHHNMSSVLPFISQSRTLSLLLQAVRNNLHSIFSIVFTPKSLNVMHSVCGSRIVSVTRSSTSLLDRYGFGPNSNRNANQRASVVGVRGSFVELTIVFWNHAARSSLPPTPSSFPRKRPESCSSSESPWPHRPSTQAASERFCH